MKMTLVTISNLDDYWLKTRDLIVEACKRSCGKFEAVDILRLLASGCMNLWVIENTSVQCVAITEIVNFPRIRVCRLICCTGKEMRNWLHYLKEIELWAKSQGCKTIEPECRIGWARVLSKSGYTRGHVLLEKALA